MRSIRITLARLAPFRYAMLMAGRSPGKKSCGFPLSAQAEPGMLIARPRFWRFLISLAGEVLFSFTKKRPGSSAWPFAFSCSDTGAEVPFSTPLSGIGKLYLLGGKKRSTECAFHISKENSLARIFRRRYYIVRL
jgi:hypothetical protein